MFLRLSDNRHPSRSPRRLALSFLLIASYAIITTYTHPTNGEEASTTQPWLPNDELKGHAKRQDNSSAAETLPDHYWKLAKRQNEIEVFRQQHNLTLVDSSPTDAALMPSWPQAMVQYILIAPPIQCEFARSNTYTTSYTTDGYTTTHSTTSGINITPFNILQLILSPFTFIAWIVSFGISQSQKNTAGWVSVMGWALWFDLPNIVIGEDKALLYLFTAPPLVFQWTASLAILIQRWTSGFGDVAYRVHDLNGCVPVDGLAYLQQGARSHSFRVLQSVTFPVATLFMLLSLGDPRNFNAALAMPAFAELVYTAYVAGMGTPMRVSGNCLLVELSPRVGFLDSSISTRWKAFSSFMGF